MPRRARTVPSYPAALLPQTLKLTAWPIAYTWIDRNVQDEPTTGLDASVANVVARTLKQLAQNGRTVILSIHQPRFSIFREFDRLLLVTDGELVYHGLGEDSLAYFASVGLPCEEHNNPADHFLDW